jgi:hypothetical protein
VAQANQSFGRSFDKGFPGEKGRMNRRDALTAVIVIGTGVAVAPLIDWEPNLNDLRSFLSGTKDCGKILMYGFKEDHDTVQKIAQDIRGSLPEGAKLEFGVGSRTVMLTPNNPGEWMLKYTYVFCVEVKDDKTFVKLVNLKTAGEARKWVV